MTTIAESAVVNGYTVRIVYDEDPENPRTWDNVGMMVCFHGRYNLGDEKDDVSEKLLGGADRRFEFVNGWTYGIRQVVNHPDLFRPWIESKPKDVALAIPLYLYDHSGLAMSAYRPSMYWQHANWDSGLVGWIFATRATLENDMGIHRLTKKQLERAEKALLAEVKEYDQFLRNEVYVYQVLDDEGEIVESCGGFYDLDEARNQGKEVAEGLEPIETLEVA